MKISVERWDVSGKQWKLHTNPKWEKERERSTDQDANSKQLGQHRESHFEMCCCLNSWQAAMQTYQTEPQSPGWHRSVGANNWTVTSLLSWVTTGPQRGRDRLFKLLKEKVWTQNSLSGEESSQDESQLKTVRGRRVAGSMPACSVMLEEVLRAEQIPDGSSDCQNRRLFIRNDKGPGYCRLSVHILVPCLPSLLLILSVYSV